MPIEWSSQQVHALECADRWFNSQPDQQVFRLWGCAGTGKTTLAKELARKAKKPLFATFTGKAAHVLRTKECPAQTIHSLIYQIVDDGAGDGASLVNELKEIIAELMAERETELRAEAGDEPIAPHRVAAMRAEVDKNRRVVDLRERIAEAARPDKHRMRWCLRTETPLTDSDLLILDECSMVDADMAEDLMSFGVKILVLGDPGQLPPIRGSGGYFTSGKPDVLLDQIHRQAEGDPIIDLATRVRTGLPLHHGTYGKSRVIRWADIKPEDALAADQIICGTNAKRRSVNKRMRELKNLTGQYPVPGDRLICLRNDKEAALLNGSMWMTRGCTVLDQTEHELSLDIEPLDGIGSVCTVPAHGHYFLGQEPRPWEIKDRQCFDFGYAITCHKAQGSQWDNVLVLDESSSFRQDASRWLYTAITRAAKSVTVVTG